MKALRYRQTLGLAAGLPLVMVLLVAACTPYVPAAVPTAPNMGEITPGPHKQVPDLSMTIEVPPFPYSTPLPPPIPSRLDGLYTKTVPIEGTPVPCRRCAGYRLEGGVWSLYFDKGVFKVFQQDTDFEAIGSFTISGDRLMLFNDPYCEENLQMVGTYTWKLDSNSLVLQAIDDSCSIGLRARNLTSSPWTRDPTRSAQRSDPCQPPNREAAITDHWPKPTICP
jgi:hypothetical protein